MISPAVVRMPHLVTHRGTNGLTGTASILATVPTAQLHLAIPLAMRDRTDLAVFDVLAASWPDLPACARFEQIGGVVSISRKRQWLILSLSGMADSLPLMADTLAAAVHTAYTDDLVHIAVSKAAQQAVLAAAQPTVDSNRRVWEAFYGDLPPFADTAPDPADVEAVSLQEVESAHARCVLPESSFLVMVGDLDPERALSLVDAALASWEAPTRDLPDDTCLLPYPTIGRILRHHRPGWTQSHLRLAGESQSRKDLDAYSAALVASLVLGGNFSSRINTVLREELGLAYRTVSSLADHLHHDIFLIEADVNPAAVPEALSTLTNLLGEFATRGPTERELTAAIGFITGAYTLSLGAQGTLASCVMSYLTTGVPLSGIAEIPDRITNLTLTEVRAAAAWYAPDRLAGVVCGDLSRLPDDL